MNKGKDWETLGGRMRHVLAKARGVSNEGISGRELARRANALVGNISESYLNALPDRLDAGKDIGNRTTLGICAAAGIDVVWFMTGKGSPEDNPFRPEDIPVELRAPPSKPEKQPAKKRTG